MMVAPLPLLPFEHYITFATESFLRMRLNINSTSITTSSGCSPPPWHFMSDWWNIPTVKCPIEGDAYVEEIRESFLFA
jgi:hypothetical protein